MANGTTDKSPHRPRALTIGGQTIEPGEIRDLQIKFSETYLGNQVSYPVRVLRAAEHGPTVFIAGAIHGDELAGIGIIRELLYDALPELLRGTLICLPVANLYGLENHSRYLPDRRDLNRCFPGSASGSLSSRLAHSIFTEIVQQCDFGIDFHAAAVRRTNYPNVRAQTSHPTIKRLAEAFGCELIIDGRGPECSLRREAVAAGVPTIILEAGEVWKTEPGVIEVGVRGCLNVLRSLRMIDGEPARPLFQVTIKSTTWVRAERGGFMSFHVRPGDLVREGQALATNFNIFGRERNALVAPQSGLVLGMTTMPAVKPGSPVFHIANIPARQFKAIERQVAGSSEDELYNRVRRHLATNITLQSRTEGMCDTGGTARGANGTEKSRGGRAPDAAREDVAVEPGAQGGGAVSDPGDAAEGSPS